MIKWFYIISLISGACHSQKAIKGTIVDMKNNPVSYVSIGVLNANIGTYSLKDGSFNLEIPIRYLKDSIDWLQDKSATY